MIKCIKEMEGLQKNVNTYKWVFNDNISLYYLYIIIIYVHISPCISLKKGLVSSSKKIG